MHTPDDKDKQHAGYADLALARLATLALARLATPWPWPWPYSLTSVPSEPLLM